MIKLARVTSFVAFAALSGMAVACKDSPTDANTPPISSPLTGLSVVASNDTVKTTPPAATGSGYFRGTVMAVAAPGSGNDSLTTKPRIAGVVVTIYPRVGTSGSEIELGTAAGTVTADAQGLFQTPTLPAGEYVVTFVPPASSPYAGSYAFGPLRSNSSEFPWWVTLNKK